MVKRVVFLAMAVLVLALGLAACASPSGETTTPSAILQPTTATAAAGLPSTPTDLEWTFGNLTIAPSEAGIGEEVVVSAWVYVYGAIGEPLAKAILAINGEVAAIREMLLEADYAELVSYTIVLQEAATHRVSFTVLLDGEDYEPGQER